MEEPDLRLVWEGRYDAVRGLWTIRIDGTLGPSGAVFTEVHHERAYSPATVRELLARAGLELFGCYEDFSFRPVTPAGRRHFYVARRNR